MSNIDIRCCDNLELMSQIEDNSVDLIYCDILYGTGRDFKDYKDLKPKRDIIEAHYIPRIKEMYRILKDTGSIYLQMDTRINHWVRCILDDVFGYDRFLNEIVWKRRGRIMNKPTSAYVRNSDRVLLYTKSKKYTFNKQYRPLSESGIYRYNRVDENGRMYRNCRIKTVLNSENSVLVFNNKEYHGVWVWTQKTLDSKIKEGVIIEENSIGDLAYRRYLDESKGVQFSDILHEYTFNKMPKYPTEKPKSLLEHIIRTSSNEGDLVADFYLGSGTTSEVCKDLNRNFIGCDISQRAVDIAKSRVEGRLF